VGAIAAARPALVVMVSCDPASFGRDVGALASAGFALDRVVLVDAFPHTPHVELVSTFLPV
jgi:23S rRNA (uracil1939-C5)-methyltransferase